MCCKVFNTCEGRIHDNSTSEREETKVYCCKVLILYVKWHNIT